MKLWKRMNEIPNPAAMDIQIETNIFDQVEEYPNCTVQVLTNSVTGEVSVGWWPNESKFNSEEEMD